MTDRPDTPPGVEARWRPTLGRWRFRVRATDPITRRRRPYEFDTIAEAEAFRARRDDARRRGTADELARGERTIGEFVEQAYFPEYVDTLELNTRPSYRSTWRKHLRPRVAHLRFRHLDGPRVKSLREDLKRAGCNPPTVRRALFVLQGICAYACEAGELTANPCRDVRKPPVTRQHLPVALSPDEIEALRGEVELPDATIVSFLAYLGLRDYSETFALEERHIQNRTLLIAQRNVNGQIVLGLKTSKHRPRDHRTPRLYQAVRDDVDAHLAQLVRRGTGRRRFLFPAADGQAWTTNDWKLWIRNVFRPAAKRADLEIRRPYDLRHTCASLMLAAGHSLVEVSEYLGNSPDTLSSTYAHLIADLRGVPPVPVEQQIAAARARRMEDAA